ncbi:hypothetical protein MJO28_016919 [Puccinia striiformis f. sp. tritici]|nr:hypothetical protein MJO28_016919 [Puccinia striiformis f. sp. tritici]
MGSHSQTIRVQIGATKALHLLPLKYDQNFKAPFEIRSELLYWIKSFLELDLLTIFSDVDLSNRRYLAITIADGVVALPPSIQTGSKSSNFEPQNTTHTATGNSQTIRVQDGATKTPHLLP